MVVEGEARKVGLSRLAAQVHGRNGRCHAGECLVEGSDILVGLHRGMPWCLHFKLLHLVPVDLVEERMLLDIFQGLVT